MRIGSLSAYVIDIPLIKPFIISEETQTSSKGVLVQIKAGEVWGWGEAHPSRRVTGERIGTVMRTIKKMSGRLKGRRPSLDLIHNILDTGSPAASAALDMALHDMVGKLEGRPVRGLLSGEDPGAPSPSSIETSITVSVGDLETTIEHARALVEKGATALKVKIGTDPEEDVRRVRALRRVFPKVKLRLDGNQAYKEDEAQQVLQAIEPYDIQFVEQPVSKRSIRAMARLREAVDIPIMADEAMLDKKGLEKIIEKEAADMINIKLMKVGGMEQGRLIAERALEGGLGVMIGCMIETRLGITAGTHLALSNPGIGYADLDGHLDLEVDVTTGGVSTRLGRNSIGHLPGLGIDVDIDRFDEYLEKKRAY